MTTASGTRKLLIDDILDLRAYERVRDQMRTDMLQMKQRRRLALGTFVTIAFENRETMLYQIQEMARVEKLITDQDIQAELDTYNSLIPEPGHLCATLFIELTSDDGMREWLPKLVGIESSVVFELSGGGRVVSRPEAQHAQQLTRSEMTSAVHYLVFDFSPSQIEALRSDGARLSIEHPNYRESIDLLPSAIDELVSDLSD